MGRLRGLSGPFGGREVAVEGELVIGRAGVDLVIDDSELSRRHASVRALDGGAVVEDLGSTNGTYVDGRRVEGPTVLLSGQRLRIGMSEFAYETGAESRSGGPGAPVAAAPASAPPAPLPSTPASLAAPPAQPADPFSASGYNAPSFQSRTDAPRRSRAPVAVMSVIALIAAGAAVYFAVHNKNSSASGATTAAAVSAAGANAAFLKSEVSPPIDKINTACVPADKGRSGPGHFRYQTSACENSTSTVATFPLHHGISGGHTVYYVITDDSNQAQAKALGVNYAPKLANAIGSGAVQKVTEAKDGTINFPATVDFKKTRVLIAGPNGFPPAKFAPPAVGAAHYSPLIELPNGTVLNAPQIANTTGQAVKVVKLNTTNMTVQYVETEGRYESKHVHYASFDSSSPLAAAIEDMTYAPALASVPKVGDEGLKTSARETLMAFINGPTGPNQPERQGINSTILDHLDPHNILHETPTLPDHPDVGDVAYTPMWDVHLIQWTPLATAAGDRIELRSLDEVTQRLAHGTFSCGQGPQQCSQGLVQGAGGKILTPTSFIADGASDFVVNCPLISIDLP